VIDVLVDFAATCPSPYTMLVLQQMHGAAARVPAQETAFAHRHDQWDCLLLSQWEQARDDERNIGWTREAWAALQPYVEQTVYVNDLDVDDGERVRFAYGENYERLVSVKAKYDPDNFFRSNQNVATGA
jgi:FAD/FMN-containing dehydrogenase